MVGFSSLVKPLSSTPMGFTPNFTLKKVSRFEFNQQFDLIGQEFRNYNHQYRRETDFND